MGRPFVFLIREDAARFGASLRSMTRTAHNCMSEMRSAKLVLGQASFAQSSVSPVLRNPSPEPVSILPSRSAFLSAEAEMCISAQAASGEDPFSPRRLRFMFGEMTALEMLRDVRCDVDSRSSSRTDSARRSQAQPLDCEFKVKYSFRSGSSFVARRLYAESALIG